MTFYAILGLWVADQGLVVSESSAMTEDGASCFADYPRKLLAAETEGLE